jgi:hypothetical protein
VRIKEPAAHKIPGVWNLRTHYRQKRAGTWTS